MLIPSTIDERCSKLNESTEFESIFPERKSIILSKFNFKIEINRKILQFQYDLNSMLNVYVCDIYISIQFMYMIYIYLYAIYICICK